MLIFKGRNRVTQPFGGDHGGIDIVGDDDPSVRSVSDGVVEQVYRWDGVTITGTPSYGNLVLIRDPENQILYYAHLDSIAVEAGKTVRQGSVLGVMGNTGYSFGAHTHFEVRSSSRTVRLNPAEYLGIPNETGTCPDPDGWYKAESKWRCRSSGSSDCRGWMFCRRYWYHMNEDGFMETGWRKISGEWYWFRDWGGMRTGWLLDRGRWYYFGSDGKMVTGIHQIGSETFCFNTEEGTLLPLGACIMTDERGAVKL